MAQVPPGSERQAKGPPVEHQPFVARERMLKILINAVSAKMGGAATYLAGLAREFAKFPDHEFIWYISPEGESAFRNAPSNFRAFVVGVDRFPFLRRLYWDQVTFRAIVKRKRPDLLYSTGNFAMLFCPVRQVVLVSQDLPFSRIWLRQIYRAMPFLSRLEWRLRRWLICASARRADIVMTPTRAMLDDLRQFVRVHPRHVMVNPFGLDMPRSAPALVAPPNPGAGCSRDFIRLCYVSIYYRHKNLGTLLRALPLLNRDGRTRFRLTTTLDPRWAAKHETVRKNEDLELARQPGIAEHVEFVGLQGRAQVQGFYHASDILVFPSFAESFGFPMAEAMMHAMPVVAADTPVNREICGEAAVYFRFDSPEDLARRVRQVAFDAELRVRLCTCGQERARKLFRWQDHARRVLETLDPGNMAAREREPAGDGPELGALPVPAKKERVDQGRCEGG